MLLAFNSKLSLIVCCLVAVSISGCGGKFSTAPVSGTITLNGSPLSDATVTFTPAAVGAEVPASTGRTDTSGKYTLSLISDDSPGALVGKHTVRIAKNVQIESDIMTPADRMKSALPDHDFSFEVKSGSNTADFKLGK